MFVHIRRLALVVITVVAVGTTGAIAASTDQQAHYSVHSPLCQKYEHFYWKAAHATKRQQVGRDICRQGINKKAGARAARRGEKARSIRTFKRWLAPPVAPVASGDTSSANAAPAYAGGSYSIPASIVMCESGGDYHAVNPSSGAYGAYQILPSTSAGLGCNMSTPAGQDDCARRVMATQGRGAWVC